MLLCTVHSNAAAKGGGMYLDSMVTATLTLVTLRGNVAAQGGAIYVISATLNMHAVAFEGHDVLQNLSGQDLYVAGSAVSFNATCPAGHTHLPYLSAPLDGYGLTPLQKEAAYSTACASFETVCPPGEGPAPGDDSCLPCAAGSYSAAADSLPCVPCGQGYYSASPSSSAPGSCLPCPAGSYSSLYIASSCSPCPPATHSPSPGAPSCSPCPANSHPSPSASSCTPCPAGRPEATNAASAADCERPPGECVQIEVRGCDGTVAEDDVNGL